MNRQLKEGLRQILPRSISGHRILGGPLRGRSIVTSWYDYPAAILGRTERYLLEWFARNVRAGETWLDVGAHYGYTAVALSKLVGPGGRVIAFEPMLATAGCVAQTRQLNNIPQLQILPLALGASPSLQTLRMRTTRGMVDNMNGSGDWEESFMATSLDWIWPRVCGSNPRIDGIKIDVQGMEIQAVNGMAGLLTTYGPKLVVEVHKGVSREVLFDALEKAGYGRRAVPVEPLPDEVEPQYADNRSYFFSRRNT